MPQSLFTLRSQKITGDTSLFQTNQHQSACFVATIGLIFNIIPPILISIFLQAKNRIFKELFLFNFFPLVQPIKQSHIILFITQKFLRNIHICHQTPVNLLFLLINTEIRNKLPESELLKQRMRLCNTFYWRKFSFICHLINIFMSFKGTIIYQRLLTFQRTLIK